MSVIFQLFCAEDLNRLTAEQLDTLRNFVRQEVGYSNDTFLQASLVISNLINRRHMQKLLAASSYVIAPNPPSAVNISQGNTTLFNQRALDELRKRVGEVFQQLTGAAPTGPSNPLTSPKLTPAELLDQLVDSSDLAKLDAKKQMILAWALTCELANFKAYEAFERIKQYVEAKFIEFTGQRPKGPDTPYSPFYPR